jgi:nucleoside 2-deoxyribosyltransferase
MDIYFAASIRGGRDDQEIYKDIIALLKKYGTVLSEHFGNAGITASSGTGSNIEKIYAQDMEWVKQADVIVAEVTQPSLGVGYEIGQAEAMGKKILCLYRTQPDRSLSAMISGNTNLTVEIYESLEDVRGILDSFFTSSAS